MTLGLSTVASDPHASLAERYRLIRALTCALAAPLTAEDCVVQSMPDASPVKWHLAHTTWFFEQFLLAGHANGYRPFHERYGYLFNSYYESMGPRHARPQRGLLTRPTLEEVHAYRESVDMHLLHLLDRGVAPGLAKLLELGLHHEQQHQELILMDVKHLLSCNPLLPAYRALDLTTSSDETALAWREYHDGIYEIGHAGEGFCFDNETPRHREYVARFELARRLVTNGEYLEFIRDGGYERPGLWLADGWATAQQQGWTRPLYWAESLQQEFTLGGPRILDPSAPVCHVSYYEADAFARWAGARLPTEAEWEVAAARAPIAGNFLEEDRLHPRAPARDSRESMQQIFGDVWEWTRSPYSAYPGFEPLPGAVGEYNGKFMANQFVLRGGSCVTSASHIRASYRNFFYPHARWQFGGIRLARDARA